MFVLLLEWNIAGRFLSLTHDLNLGAFGSDIIKYQFGPRDAFGVDSSPNANLDILEVLASLE